MAGREDDNIARVETAFGQRCRDGCDCVAAHSGEWFINVKADAECKNCGRVIPLADA